MPLFTQQGISSTTLNTQLAKLQAVAEPQKWDVLWEASDQSVDKIALPTTRGKIHEDFVVEIDLPKQQFIGVVMTAALMITANGAAAELGIEIDGLPLTGETAYGGDYRAHPSVIYDNVDIYRMVRLDAGKHVIAVTGKTSVANSGNIWYWARLRVWEIS